MENKMKLFGVEQCNHIFETVVTTTGYNKHIFKYVLKDKASYDAIKEQVIHNLKRNGISANMAEILWVYFLEWIGLN